MRTRRFAKFRDDRDGVRFPGLAGLAACLTLLAAPFASGAEPITAANWRQHPAIVEIRATWQETAEAETARRLRRLQRTFEHYRSYEDTERTLHLDEAGSVRSYRVGKGSEDSAARSASCHDRDGALRFVLVQAGAADGTRIEYRIYLSRAGERLWEERRGLEGPGWTFPARLPDDWLVRDPKQAFHAGNPCPEVKPQ